VNPSEILIADDHVELAENLGEILRETLPGPVSCRIVPTVAGATAAATPSLDLALVDLHLPDGSGTSLIEPLRSRAPFAQVVVITGDATVESAIAAIGHGAFGYVLKPFKSADLLETVKRALDRARLLREHENLRSALERSEQRHRAVIEGGPAFVLALDRQGRIVIWNRRLEEVTGRSRNEMLGQPGRALLGDGKRELRLATANGEDRRVRWQLADLPSAPDEGLVTLAIGIDVTGEREALRRAMRAERLAAVGTLAAGLAHEVRNPLNSASLQLQVLKRRLARGKSSAETLGTVVELVDAEIRRLDHLVSDFLAFARPAPMELRRIELNGLVSAVGELVRPECTTAGVELVVDADRDIGAVQGDDPRLRQVLLNVIRNGVEAVGDRGTVTVQTQPADDHGDVAIVIEDDGPGFPEDAPIFDAFYTTKEQGTGLGLSIVHRIVSEHGGSISVESRPGRTRFSIRLPQSTPTGQP
jgi:signal transduction histidine kinase